MRSTKKILTLVFAIVLLMGVSAIASQAQTRRYYRRPVIVRQYYNPFWSPFYSSYYYDPYYSERRQRYYLENRVEGNERELRQHLRKYNADGVLTAKERRELEDDYSDVARSRANLRRYYRNY